MSLPRSPGFPGQGTLPFSPFAFGGAALKAAQLSPEGHKKVKDTTLYHFHIALGTDIARSINQSSPWLLQFKVVHLNLAPDEVNFGS